MGNNPANFVDPSGLKKAVFIDATFLGYPYDKLTWNLDDKEIAKINELKDIANAAREEIAFIRKNVHRLNSDDISCDTLDDQLRDLDNMIRYADDYESAIHEWKPNLYHAGPVVTITFPFDKYENGIPEWKNLLRIAGEAFQHGVDVGISEGAGQIGRKFRQLKHYENAWEHKTKFTPNETKLLNDFFKSGGKVRPKGLSDETLLRYRERARTAVEVGHGNRIRNEA